METVTLVAESLLALLFSVAGILLLLPHRSRGHGTAVPTGSGEQQREDEIRWDDRSGTPRNVTYNIITINKGLREEASDAEVTGSSELFSSCPSAAESITREKAHLMASLDYVDDRQERERIVQALVECGLVSRAEGEKLVGAAIGAPLQASEDDPGPVPPPEPRSEIRL